MLTVYRGIKKKKKKEREIEGKRLRSICLFILSKMKLIYVPVWCGYAPGPSSLGKGILFILCYKQDKNLGINNRYFYNKKKLLFLRASALSSSFDSLLIEMHKHILKFPLIQ